MQNIGVTALERIEGLDEDFRNAKSMFMTTFANGEEHTRVMTNFNTDPYSDMWFPTETDTRKVKDIKNNPKIVITFPCEEYGCFYEIEGEAWMEDPAVVNQKWQWWWLSWRPSQRRRFWFPRDREDPRRAIINIRPKSVRKVKKA